MFFSLKDIILLSPSESLGEVEEAAQAAAEAPPAFTSQTSTASVTSSEPTGTDSHCEEDCTHMHINISALTVTVLFFSFFHTLFCFLFIF